MTLHGALSVKANIRTGMEEGLAKLLDLIDQNPSDNPLVPFGKMKSIHFARFVLCPAAPDAKGHLIPAQLVFSTNYDKPRNNDTKELTPQASHIRDLTQNAGPGLWQVFSFCENFPAGEYNETSLNHFLNTKAIKANTFYVGVGNRSVSRIRDEDQLRKTIELLLDQNREKWATLTAKQIREEVRHFIFRDPLSKWAILPEPVLTPAQTFSMTLKLLLVILVFIILSPILIPFALIWWLIILIIELTEKDKKDSIEKDHLTTLLAREKGIVQNQFSAFGNVKPGWFRKQTMLFLLKLTDFLAPYIFSKGALSGIPTVHFARWLVISEGRQMLFLSNYDGNSEGYLRDFIDIAGKQLTLLFSHTMGYPKTYFMVFGGAKDAIGFMQWARQSQIITNVWYSANPGISVKNVFQNSKIRSGLYGNMNEKRSRAWLRLF